MSAARVMAATQSLRDGHRAITYNRSDCPYLPTGAFRDAPATLARAAANLGVSWSLDFSGMPRCFDDAKIDAHTGIIPQDVAVDVSALSADERLVDEEVCKRYAMQFAGDERFEVSSTTVGVPGGTLSHVAKRTVTTGWRAISDDGRGSKGYQEGWLDAGAHSLVVRRIRATRERTKPEEALHRGHARQGHGERREARERPRPKGGAPQEGRGQARRARVHRDDRDTPRHHREAQGQGLHSRERQQAGGDATGTRLLQGVPARHQVGRHHGTLVARPGAGCGGRGRRVRGGRGGHRDVRGPQGERVDGRLALPRRRLMQVPVVRRRRNGPGPQV